MTTAPSTHTARVRGNVTRRSPLQAFVHGIFAPPPTGRRRAVGMAGALAAAEAPPQRFHRADTGTGPIPLAV